jgi:hypothetical protein
MVVYSGKGNTSYYERKTLIEGRGKSGTNQDEYSEGESDPGRDGRRCSLDRRKGLADLFLDIFSA